MIVVLTILKWMGIIFLGVVGFLLLLLALLMFVPVRYMIRAECGEKICYAFRFGWLYPLVYVKKTLESSRIVLCVLGIPVHSLAGEEKEKAEKEKADEGKKNGLEEKKTSEEKHVSSETLKPSKPVSDSDSRKKNVPKSRSRKKKQKKKHFSFETVSGIIGFIREDETKSALATLKNELLALFRYLSPYRLEGDFLIGTGDPASTGLLFGGISLIPAVYQKGLQLTPDFEEKVFRGKGKMRGKIRIIYFIRLVIRLYRDEDLQRVWKRINK